MSPTIDRARAVCTLIDTFEVAPPSNPSSWGLARVTPTLIRGDAWIVGAAVHRSLDGRHVVNFDDVAFVPGAS